MQSHSLLEPISALSFEEDFIQKATKSGNTLVTIIQNEVFLSFFF
jgi:hypothetical protein